MLTTRPWLLIMLIPIPTDMSPVSTLFHTVVTVSVVLKTALRMIYRQSPVK